MEHFNHLERHYAILPDWRNKKLYVYVSETVPGANFERIDQIVRKLDWTARKMSVKEKWSVSVNWSVLVKASKTSRQSQSETVVLSLRNSATS